MNNKDFIEEIHKFIDNRYKLFEEYQQIVNSILQEFDRICIQKGINYVLAYGNAIGAVRDHGQLPWDYDVDLLVPFSDKKLLIEALNTDLSDDYYYVYHNNTARYPTICLRVGKKGYSWLALHVDVFFYTGAPNDEMERSKIVDKIIKYRAINTGRNYGFHQLEKKSPSTLLRLYSFLSRIKNCLVPNNKIELYMEEIGKKYPISKSKYVVTFGGIKVSSYKKELFEPLRVDVNGTQLPIPKGYDMYLKMVYTDYMSYLPIKKRFEEFYNMCNIVEERQALYEQRSNQ